MELETWNLEPETRNPEPETRNLELGTWNLELGTQSSVLAPAAPAFFTMSASSEVGEYQDKEMRREPDILIAHILVNVDKNKDTGNEDAHQHVEDIRYGVSGVPVLNEVNEQDDPGKEQRQKQEIEIHKSHLPSVQFQCAHTTLNEFNGQRFR